MTSFNRESDRAVLVVAAHPDDETLGMGGTLARLTSRGVQIHCMFLTNGVGARGEGRQEEILARRKAAETAAKILGISGMHFYDFPDNGMDTVPLLEIVQAIEDFVKELNPDTVYTHHDGDLNVDHVITRKATVTACRPLPSATVRKIYAFEVPSSTEWEGSTRKMFQPQRFVSIDVEEKLKALRAYEAEMRAYPHPRSLEAIEALARWRGASCGVLAAEAFEVVREVCE